MRKVADRQIVEARCERAAAAGVTIGMTLAHAQALLIPVFDPSPSASLNVDQEELCVFPYQPERDESALRGLATWAIRFAPIVAPDPPDGLLLDITGCQRLHGGERRLINTIANNLEWLGFRARIACASTFACAWAVARFGDHDRAIVSEGDERIAMHPLPVESLGISESIVGSLHEVGVATVGELMCIPRLQLAARYGDDLLLHIDQVFGEAIESIDPIRPVPLLKVERAFDGPVKQTEAIELASRDLLEQLIGLLHEKERGVTRIAMTFERIDAPDIHDSIRLTHPSRDFRHLWSLIRPRIEHLHLGFGIERITFVAAAMSRIAHRQHGVRKGDSLDENRASVDHAIGELTDHFIARLGPDRVSHIHTHESHVPERAAERMGVDLGHQMRSTGSTETVSTRRRGDTEKVQSDERCVFPPRLRASAFKIEHLDSPVALIRPSRLFTRPLPIEVVSLSPEGPLLSIRIRSELLEVIDTIGPERIAEEWWLRKQIDSGTRARDYYKTQIVSGRWLWLFRELITRRWFLHGEWI